MKTIIFCKDCKYGQIDQISPSYHYFARCTHPTSVCDTDLVTGYNCYRTCESMRTSRCGSEAKLFEQKKPWWKLF